MSKSERIIFLYRGPHHIHLEFAKSVGAEPYSNYLVHNYKQIPKVFIPFSFIIRLFTLPKANIYLCEDGYSLILAYLKRIFDKKIKIILIAASPLFYKIEKKKNYIKKIFKSVFKTISGVIAVSNFNKNYARKYLNCPIEVVYPFIDIKKYNYSLNINGEKILYLGKINKFKGVDLIIDAFKKCKVRKPNSSLILCGSNNEKEIRVKIPGVEYSGCYVKDPRVYFKKCFIIVNATIFDTFAVSVLQAMACGIIPIVTEYSGVKEIVSCIDDKLVIKRNTKSISEAMIKILNLSYKSRILLSKKCRKIALKFDKNRQVNKFKRAFKKFTS